MDVNALIAQANAAAAESDIDMNEAVGGGGSARLLPVGNAFAVLAGVVQLGKQPQEYQGKAKDPADEVQLTFALVGGIGQNGEKYVNEDGTPYILNVFPIAMQRNEKARAFRAFQKMNWRKTAKDFPQLLGQAFLLPITQKERSVTDKTMVSRPDLTGILPPVNPMDGQPYAVPQVDAKHFKLFLWERPTLEMWDSLYVEGTFDDGNTKNIQQGTIAAALNFQGSPIQTMLLQNSRPMPNPVSRKKAAAAPAAPAGSPIPGPGAIPAPGAAPTQAAQYAPPPTPATAPNGPSATNLAVAPALPSMPIPVPGVAVAPLPHVAGVAAPAATPQ